MDGKVSNYYKNNNLYARKMVIPNAGEKFRNSCKDCQYYVSVKGQQAIRQVCLSNIKNYRTGQKRIPTEIDIFELMLLLGKQNLEEMINRGGQNQMACGIFEQKQ